MEKISIVIRTYNESYWIPHLIVSLKKQSIQNFEIIQVDNHSTDNSVELLQNSSLNTKLVKIENYLPGAALNRGIEVSDGETLVFLSAHCLPNSKQWLEYLVKPIVNGTHNAVYGRQIPCESSHPIDVRDLLLTFPNESRVQSRNSFFHNANSAISKGIWMKYSFSESATNIEDRIFGEELIKAGLTIYYSADAIVTHQHGLHQTTNIDRLRGVTDILEKEQIIQYENKTFVTAHISKRYVTIESDYNLTLNTESTRTAIITNNKKLSNEFNSAFYLPYDSNDKVLDILRLFAQNYPNDYICYYDWKSTTEENVNNLSKRLRVGDLAKCFGRRIKNPILNSSYLNKGILNSYSRDLKNAIQYELFFNKGLIIHSSLLLASKNNDKIFQALEVFE